uniref:G protein-coupled receptor n=1 Tax=Panagrolaimus sp. PS1159 TaxID=55785 RepID=A0AC35GXB7_9BILA
MHAQMTITMILQAIVPLIFVLIPIGCAFTAALALIDVPGLGMIINLMCCWIPVANPLVTIFSIRSYRIFIFNCYQKFLAKVHLKYSAISFHPTASSVTDNHVSRNIYTLKN